MASLPVIQPNRARSSKFTEQYKSVLDYIRKLEIYLDQEAGNTSDETLYWHQVKAVLSLHKYFSSDIGSTVNSQNSRVALVVLPTGCGKTGVAVLASYVLSASRVLVITPSVIISKQIDDAFKEFLVKRKIIRAQDLQYYAPHTLLVLNSEQLLNDLAVHQVDLIITNAHKVSDNNNPRRRVRLEDIPFDLFDLVIVDEAHHYPAKTSIIFPPILKRFF